MRDIVKRWAFLFLVSIAALAVGQMNPSGANSRNTELDKRDTSVPGLGTRVAQSVVNDSSDPDDHVRCFFTLKQLMKLRPIPGIATLTAADQSQVLTSLVEAVDSASEKEFSRGQKANVIGVLAGKLDGKLIGKTPGEALATIVHLLYDNSGNAQLNGAVVDSARNAINKLVPPADIGCAYQILSWNESRLLFGRSVANNFIGVQVTVRNLNAKEEFIIHNAMLAVDTDIHGAIGQYLEGVDKIGIEAYNNAGESLTGRGITGNSIAAASALLSTLQPIVNVGNFSNSVAAFTGGVVPGWKTMSPDHQKDQLLLIANSGFSATYTTKTVVGKSGAATFYTWFPAKPFLQGWWLQKCSQSIVTVEKPAEEGANPAEEGTNPPQVGVDLVRARKACQGVKDWETKPYKNWSSISDELFRDLSLAVVAGIHVQEDSKNKSSIIDLKCPKNPQGELDMSKASSDGTISCDVTGDNLDKVAKLRLENAGNAVDPTHPEAIVNVSGDNTNAKAAFKVSDLASAPAATYNVYTVGKDGTETPTGLNVNLDLKTIALTGVEPIKIDAGSLPTKVTLTGYNLNNLNKVCLKNETDVIANRPTLDVKNNNSRTQATIDGGSLKLSVGEWEIYFNYCSEEHDSKQKFIVSGVAAPLIESFSPTSASSGQTVTIKGSNLSGASVVTFGGIETNPVPGDDSKLTALVPEGAKSGSLGVTTPGGTKAKDGFKVLSKTKVVVLPSKTHAAKAQ